MKHVLTLVHWDGQETDLAGLVVTLEDTPGAWLLRFHGLFAVVMNVLAVWSKLLVLFGYGFPCVPHIAFIRCVEGVFQLTPPAIFSGYSFRRSAFFTEGPVVILEASPYSIQELRRRISGDGVPFDRFVVPHVEQAQCVQAEPSDEAK